MDVKARLAVVADGNVSDRAQHLALFANFDPLVALRCNVEPSDGRLFEGADRSQRCRGNPGLVGEFRQRRKRLLAAIEDDDVNLRSRPVGYELALHVRCSRFTPPPAQAALRCAWRPSLISSMILALNASR